MRKATKILLFLLVLLQACTKPGSLGAGDYLDYVQDPDNGLSRRVLSGIYDYTIQLATPEYLVSEELEHADITYAATARLKELEGNTFFIIKIGKTAAYRTQAGGQEQAISAQQADAMVAYYDQLAAADIVLKSGDLVLHPVTYHFENNYGLVGYNTIVVGFETGAITTDLQLSFTDRFNKQPSIQAGFDRKSIENIPRLNIKH